MCVLDLRMRPADRSHSYCLIRENTREEKRVILVDEHEESELIGPRSIFRHCRLSEQCALRRRIPCESPSGNEFPAATFRLALPQGMRPSRHWPPDWIPCTSVSVHLASPAERSRSARASIETIDQSISRSARGCHSTSSRRRRRRHARLAFVDVERERQAKAILMPVKIRKAAKT